MCIRFYDISYIYTHTQTHAAKTTVRIIVVVWTDFTERARELVSRANKNLDDKPEFHKALLRVILYSCTSSHTHQLFLFPQIIIIIIIYNRRGIYKESRDIYAEKAAPSYYDANRFDFTVRITYTLYKYIYYVYWKYARGPPSRLEAHRAPNQYQ